MQLEQAARGIMSPSPEARLPLSDPLAGDLVPDARRNQGRRSVPPSGPWRAIELRSGHGLLATTVLGDDD